MRVIGRPGAGQLKSWNGRFVVPFLANHAARAEMAGRLLAEETQAGRSRLAGSIASQPVAAVLALAGIAYLVGFATKRRR
jgi:hypothetical protein